ncbi:2-amino-4-hydroxy-6-hydroxymethyldihydropteridine diphosphokinase [Mucilaginibacter yixingensis]|uniref:2-amino-4-hydroxy-6-hydroxymethyldihydropteridine pyrophosphokinase n=1 Tax=Mucilaginibacter yixingensis TaxID=1295612 RepID=A0A2T5JFZ8_9SPHI|nr:2-amino-4-hydroxy-6-hydroxymethyldihydropteridine diphosphokinase [Mucilaginibacter yixingensis]PTR01357.1 2-amino-4-hydroxy-6-hydroxymethyldihydropteridine diphosphokinase [Mucilaginibacter yixingensis]
MVDVFLLLGSNMGERHDLLKEAAGHIAQTIAPVLKASSVYETGAWGKTDEPDYLNQVLLLQTDMPARDVLNRVLSIEQQMGRKREVKWGARSIDIDILFYGDAIMHEPGLTVPHPQLHNRRFTLEPLVEIAPNLHHPVLNQTIVQLKNNLNDCLVVKKL